MLSEKKERPRKKTGATWFHLYEESKKRKQSKTGQLVKTECKMVVIGPGRWRNRERF